MRNYLGFMLGIAVGAVGLLCAQLLMEAPDELEVAPAVEMKRLNPGRDTQNLAEAHERILLLEAEVAAADSGGGTIVESAGAVGEEKGEKDKAASFIEMMMSFGDNEAQREIDKEVGRIAGLMNLSENQQDVLRAALQGRLQEQKAAGVRLMTGEASINDLLLADEHNFSSVDAALAGVLDVEQLEQLEVLQVEREMQRVMTKTEEELGALSEATELTDDQQKAAWQILSDINAGEKPGDVPEGLDAEGFIGIVDEALDKRINGMAPILNEEQRQVYEGQVGDFRDMVTKLISHSDTPDGEE
ncbi:MAG: hypothetical protein ACI8XO_000725 [Verrucomicrobiales bacterium]|jgi:hypothetical protein